MYILVQNFTPQVLGVKRTSDVEEYIIGEQKSRKRQNYFEQMGVVNELFENIDDVGPPYDTKLIEPEISKKELPAFIVDYANMIRNDIILLDNSIETRTRKRGNIKVEKHNVSRIGNKLSTKYLIYRSNVLFYIILVTTKKGNVSNNFLLLQQAIPDPPCNCEYNVSIFK